MWINDFRLEMGCRMFDSHNQVIDSHCLLKSKMNILCLVYLYSCNNFLQTTCQICYLLQRFKFDFNQEYFQQYEEKHDTNIFSERAAYENFIFEGFILFPSAKSNKQGGKVFFKEIWGVPRKDIETMPIFLRTLERF